MEEKQKVYIKGVSDRGNEVIKTLEDCGASNSCGYIGDYDAALYFINHDGIIDCTRDHDAEFAKIIMDNYTELHLPEKWKDGDLLVCHMLSGNRYAVYSDDSELMKCNTIITYTDVDNHTYGVNRLFDKEDFTLASDEEHKEFYNLLHKHGVDWNAEKKQLVKWKWNPNKGDYYYYISSLGKVIRTNYLDTDADKSSFDFGNCFCTEEEANTMAKKIKKLLNE